jgi:hypothetical protein
MSLKDKISLIGGKSAGLVWLTENTDLGFSVPEFEIIDTSYYEDFLVHRGAADNSKKCTEKLKAKCDELAKKFAGKMVAVRSSGVISEDSERFSGAGIYDTFFLEAMAVNSENIEATVLDVYQSVISDRAKQYRKEAEFIDEKMAVVVQEFVKGDNGAAMSRLPARAGIIPVLWSGETGAVVQRNSDATVHTMYFTPKGRDNAKGAMKTIFESDTDIHSDEKEFVKDKLIPLIVKLKERYGKEFELEFTFELNSGKLSLLQIRPLTNVKDVQVNFPDKVPIFSADLCMGVGEYIGPWASPVGEDPVNRKKKWKEPPHYAYIASRMEKKKQKVQLKRLAGFRNVGTLLKVGEDFTFDYDKLTPNKKAIILTHQALPGMHAMTIANEKDILCLAKEERELTDEEAWKEHGTGKDLLMIMSGKKSPLEIPKFNVPFDEIGKYIHVVSDGLKGHVYRATEQEAIEFARKNNLSMEKFKV